MLNFIRKVFRVRLPNRAAENGTYRLLRMNRKLFVKSKG